jgi:hypothetical protein
MKNKKVRLGHGSWERNGSLFESDYWVTASLLAHIDDPTAIKQNRPYTAETINRVVKQLKVMFPTEPFTIPKVRVYVDASATNQRIINKDTNLKRTRNYYTQLEQFRKAVSIK